VRTAEADDEPPGMGRRQRHMAAVTSEAGTSSTDRIPLATPIREVERTTLPMWVRLLPRPPGSHRVEYPSSSSSFAAAAVTPASAVLNSELATGQRAELDHARTNPPHA
jgi:hypothetical protein